MRTAINVVIAYAGWFAVAWLAARGETLAAVLPSLAVVAAHLFSTPREDRGGEFRLAIAAAGLGLLADMIHSGLGFVDFGVHSPGGILPPYFMVGLWMAFSTMLNVSLGWLQGRTLLAAVLGAAGGALSYAAGARLGAIQLGEPWMWSLAGIGLVWVVAFPALLALARWITPQPRS